MLYEINVSQFGKHLFATDKRRLTIYAEALRLYILFNTKFPKDDGYKVTITKIETTESELTIQTNTV